MNIADLFVNLGITGADKTVGALGDVKKGMGELKSMSIEAKAAILGAMYGLERLMAQSGQTGTGLVNFAALTGQSLKQIQQWRYGMIQAGGTAEEMDQNIKNIQKSMAAVDLGKGIPEGLAILSQAAGGIDFSKKDDPFYMMRAFEKGIKNLGDSPKGKAIANYLAQSVGLSEDMITGFRRGKFDDKVLNKAPIYSDKEAGQLDKSNIAWKNLGQQIQMSIGHFNAAHGGELVKDITKLVKVFFDLLGVIEKVSEKFRVFDVLSDVFRGWGIIFEGIDKVLGKMLGGEHGENFDKKTGKLKDTPTNMLADWFVGQLTPKYESVLGKGTTGASGGDVNVTQNIVHHGDAKDTASVGQTHKAAAHQAQKISHQRAFSQMRTNGGG